MKKLFLLGITTLLTVSTYAAETKLSIHDLVNDFYAAKEIGPIKKLQNLHKTTAAPRARLAGPGCNPETYPSCEEVVCDKLGTFGCDEINEIQEVRRACRGNYNGNCVNEVCDRFGSFGCDDINEVKSVARACVGNYDMSCFSSTCDRLGTFGCDEISEATQVLRACSGY